MKYFANLPYTFYKHMFRGASELKIFPEKK